jgi:hypothetical protein
MILLWGKKSKFNFDFFIGFSIGIDDHKIVIEGSVNCESSISYLFCWNQRIIDNVLQTQFD